MVCMMWLKDRDVEDPGLFTDACLKGIGAVLQTECLRTVFPQCVLEFKGWSIAHYEFLALIVAVQVWRQWVTGKRFRAYCDNQVVVSVVNTGRAKDVELQKLLRWLCYLMTMMDSLIKLEYVETRKNRKADILSRSSCGKDEKRRCDMLIQDEKLQEQKVEDEFWILWDGW